jgi:hypothetical protein
MQVVPCRGGLRKIGLLIGVAVMLLAAGPAHAEDVLEHAGETLTLDPVYVAPDAEFGVSDSEADDLRSQITDEDADPLFIAVLPASADDSTGGDPVAALRDVADKANEPGVYAAVIGRSFRAGATRDELSGAQVGRMARAAFAAEQGNGTYAVLSEFVRRVGVVRGSDAGRASASDENDSNGGGSVWLWVLLAVVGVVALLGWLGRRRRLREEAQELSRARAQARDSVIALGDEIRALDLDMELPDVDPEAKSRYGEAVECYQQAEQALEGARTPDDLEHIDDQVCAGRRAIEAARMWASTPQS